MDFSTILAARKICNDDTKFKITLLHFYTDSSELRKCRFSWNSIPELKYKLLFRFEKQDFIRLLAAFGLPDTLRTRNGIRFTTAEGKRFFRKLMPALL